MLVTIVTALALAVPTWTDPPDPPLPAPSCVMQRDVMAQVLFARGLNWTAVNNLAALMAAGCGCSPAVTDGGT